MNADAHSARIQPLDYRRHFWGDILRGTKEQLQSHGLGIGCAFPGEPGGPKLSFRTVDPTGIVCTIKLLKHQAIFEAIRPFPNLPPSQGAMYRARQSAFPGVTITPTIWADEFKGAAEDLVAAGLVRREHLPGAPGMAKTRVDLDDAGNAVPRRQGRLLEHGTSRTRIYVQRVGVNRFAVGIRVSSEESARRRDAMHREDAAEVLRAAAVTPPPRLEPTYLQQMRAIEVAHAAAARDQAFQRMLTRMVASHG